MSAALVVTGCSTKTAETEAATKTTTLSKSTPQQFRAITNAPPAPNSLVTRPRRMGDIEYIRYDDEPMKPATRQKGPLLPGKADAASDLRFYNPDHYAITEAPPEGIRPMVEWEPMTSITMSVPTYMTNGNYENAFGTIVDIAKHSATVAEVWFVVSDETAKGNIQEGMLAAGSPQSDVDEKVKFLIKPNETVWMIDFGPLPIIDAADESYAFADFRYYYERATDDGISTVMARNLVNIDQASNVDTYRMPIDTEGGTFQATSDGVCFTGARQLYNMSCLDGGCDSSLITAPLAELQDNEYTLELEAAWSAYAGCTDVVVTYSITDDGTGHIDMYMKVAADDHVIMGEYLEPYGNNQAEANAERMDANAEFIANYVKPNGGSFNVSRIVMPGHRNTNSGAMPFTYINSTLINGLNLWPAYTFDDWVESRDQAEAEWTEALPDYDHIWIDSEELAFWSGAIHCITRTVPAKTPSLWVGDGTCTDDMCVAPEGGYDSECSPNGIDHEVCYGPDWLCTCNDCDSGCDYEPGEPPADNLCAEVECGSYAPNNGINCSCDEACVQYQDCCSDACDVCGVGCDGTAPEPQGCNGLTYEGCCDGQVLTWCENDAVETIDCGENPQCGWSGEEGFYNCGTDGAAESTGQFPIECPAGDGSSCTPDCSGKSCGDDGCGGSCGVCEGDALCTNAGQCVELCIPACANKTCGDDGCGGSCGTCSGDTPFCAAGNCVPECTPDCAGVSCGDDGCGGTCGTCPEGEACQEGACAACVPACDGKSCGSDGCGGSCGVCADGESCTLAGECVTLCTADCSGKACGGDGCGGTCGTCPEVEACSANGQCEVPCVPDCTGKTCGDDGCGGSCGTCQLDETCDASGACQSQCVPNCVDKSCGDDGCGGSCGTCAEGEACSELGACEATARENEDAAGAGADAGGSGEEPGPVDPTTPTEPGSGTSEIGTTGGEAGVGGEGGGEAVSSGCEGAPQGALPWFMALLLAAFVAMRRERKLN